MPHKFSVALRCSPLASEMSSTTEAVPITTPIAVSATRPLRRLRLSKTILTRSKNRIVHLKSNLSKDWLEWFDRQSISSVKAITLSD